MWCLCLKAEAVLSHSAMGWPSLHWQQVGCLLCQMLWGLG